MIKDGILLAERYTILEKIGAGGMADVYKGKDTKLNRFIAIKVLKREYREDENFVKKFRTEAQSAAGLMHPNVVNVYDVGEDRGLNYMVMELVEGITLKEYIEKKGKLSAKETISITIQICNGIEAAHKHHIIHRDIKPQNVIISKEGKVKVTDFGIAKATSSNTISTNAMGSVHYTSPEQARGGFSDAKSDVYSVGITMFEMVTGRVPFDGESTVAIAMQHLQKDITLPSAYVPDIPKSLEEIILKCTQKSPDRRYPDMALLILDLKRSLVDPEGNFVGIAPLGAGDETVMITPEEMERIQQGNEYDDDEYDDDEYDDDEYDDDEYDDEYDDDEEEYRGRRKKGNDEVNPKMAKIMKILTIVVAVIILFILVFVIGKAAGIFKFGDDKGITAEETDQVKVPNLVGMDEDKAKDLCSERGLGFKVVTREESDQYEQGVVSEQKTEAGTKVDKNTQIQVVVSSGLVGEKITVPDVSGLSEDEAKQELKAAGFPHSEPEFVYSDKDEGEVIGTTPSAGSEATKDTTIMMQVSKGSEKVSVPGITGKSESAAKAALSEAGLKGKRSGLEYSDSVKEGRIISQGITSGKKVSSGTTVSYVVSKGPEPAKTVSVPSITGMSESAARSALKKAGLNVGTVRYVYSDEKNGTVIDCEPGIGSTLNKGDSVNLTVSRGPKNQPSEPNGDPNQPSQ